VYFCIKYFIRFLVFSFLTEINECTEEVPPELMKNELTREAVGYMERAAYTKEQLARYNKCKIAVMTERSAINDAKREGLAEGEAIGIEKGEAIGLEKGEHQKAVAVTLKAIKMGMSIEDASKLSGISEQQIKELSIIY
jgi:flagellar biosynthesis/type III secretory pathway protein FliH